MKIDEILSAASTGELPLIAPGWGQGRTTFGGLTAAILYQRIRNEVDEERQVRSFDINFVRPLEALKPYEVDIQTLADGKTATIKRAYLIQDGKLRATATANFLRKIESSVTINRFTVPDMHSLEKSTDFLRHDVPDFFQHFEIKIGTSAHPFSGQETPSLGGWMRFKEAPEKISEAHLICMIDAWPPTASPNYEGFKPLSTMSWGIHFTAPTTALNPESHIGYHSEVNFSEHGVSSSTAQVWDENGSLLANSTQTNIIYG